jgi:hypothetical protein
LCEGGQAAAAAAAVVIAVVNADSTKAAAHGLAL